MLDHFFGSYRLNSRLSGLNAQLAFDSAGEKLSLKKYQSSDHRFILYASKICAGECSEDIGRPNNSRVLALAGILGIVSAENEKRFIDDDFSHLLTKNNSQLCLELKKANGTFAVLAYDETDGLLLATDSLGARPLYFAERSGVIYFATSFSLIKKIYPAPLDLDKQALAELISFYYPLSARTLSSNVSILRDGEFLIANDERYRTDQYHDWRQIVLSDRNLGAELEACADAFCTAVASRMTQEPTQFALLSGGLDSRMIVARLREENQPVTASNYSYPGTLDEQYCVDFAAVSRAKVSHVSWEPDLHSVSAGNTTSTMLKRALSGLPSTAVFSGDGGGEVFGFMMLSKALLDVLNTHGLDSAISYYSSHLRISRHVVAPEFADELDSLALAGMSSEFKRMDGIHPEKSMQLFFLLNDLRCHLHEYFDSTDPNARELLLPFYDRRVLESVLQISPPFSEYISHQFYYGLLPLVSSLNLAVAWQSYPSSLPCPIPTTRNGMNQWEFSKKSNQLTSASWRRSALGSVLSSRWIPGLRYGNIIALAIFDMLPSRDYSYIFKQHMLVKDVYSSLNDSLCG